MITAITLHEDAFYEFFKPYRHPESCDNIWGGLGLETYGKDFKTVLKMDESYVWTVLDGCESNDQWITPGIHFVNRICYMVTEKPHLWIPVEFRIPSRFSSLTPIGLLRQMNKVTRLIQAAQQSN
jgi:hypothetical protein